MHNGTITPHVFRSVSKEQHYEENGCQVGTVFSALVRAAPNLQNWLVPARASTPLSCHILINSTLITRARRSTVFSRQNKKIVYPPDPNTHLCQTGDWKLSGQQCHSFALIIGGCGHWFLLWRRSILRGSKVCTSGAAETSQYFFSFTITQYNSDTQTHPYERNHHMHLAIDDNVVYHWKHNIFKLKYLNL